MFFFLKNYMYTYCRSIISSLLTCSFPVDYKTIGKFMLIFFWRNYPWGNELKRVERTIVANTWIYSSIHAYNVRAIKDYQSDQSIVKYIFTPIYLLWHFRWVYFIFYWYNTGRARNGYIKGSNCLLCGPPSPPHTITCYSPEILVLVLVVNRLLLYNIQFTTSCKEQNRWNYYL